MRVVFELPYFRGIVEGLVTVSFYAVNDKMKSV
jgi:hypothetical protein